MNPHLTLRQKTQRGLFWAGGEAVARTVLQTAVLAALSRLLTPDDYGVVGAALIVVGISSIFSQLGVGPAIVQRPTLELRHLDAAFVVSAVFGLLTAGLIFFAAPLFASFFKMETLTPVLRTLALIFPITSCAVVSESLLQRDLRFDLIARAEIISYVVGYGLVAVTLACFGWKTWALVCGQIVQMATRTELLFGFHPWRPRLACEGSAVRDLRRFSGGMTISRLANYIASSGDNLVVGRYLGAGALGLYGRAYQLMSQPAILVGNVLEKVLFPAMAKIQGKHERLAAIYRQGVRILATVMLPVSAIIYLCAPEIVGVILGPQWGGVVIPLQIFSGALLFRTSMKMSNSLIRAKGALSAMVTCQVSYAAATVGLAYVGSAWGILGVCAGVFCSILLCFLLAAGMSLRLVGLNWGHFLQDHLPGLLLGAVVFAVGWCTATVLRDLHMPELVVLFATLAAALGVSVTCGLAAPRLFLGPEGETIIARGQKFLARSLSITPPAGAAVTARLPELDVLRGIAAVAVVLFHYTVRYHEVFAPASPPVPPHPGGHFAVHLFFMISGFVIFMTLVKTRTALDFIVSRVSRLYPVYWVAVLITAGVLACYSLPGRAPGLGQVAANLTMLQFWLRTPPVDGVYWTLAVELAFYAIMLGIFLSGRLQRIEQLVLPWLMLELGWAYLGAGRDLPKIIEVTFLLKYAHLFLAGILFYRLRFVGSTPGRHTLLVLCLTTHWVLNGLTGGLLGTLFFAAFYALAYDRLAWIAARPLVFLGTISYSLYLIHQNIGFVLMRAMSEFPRPLQISIAVVAMLLLASALTFFVERPALRALRACYHARTEARTAPRAGRPRDAALTPRP